MATDSYNVKVFPLYRVGGKLPDHLIAALWLWQSRRSLADCPTIDQLGPDDLEGCGAAERFHIFDVSADDPLGYYMRRWSPIGNLAPTWDALGVPLRGWPYPVQANSHADSLVACAEGRKPVLARVDRVLAGRPQSYVRLLCPLYDSRQRVTRIASIVEVNEYRITSRLIDQSGPI